MKPTINKEVLDQKSADPKKEEWKVGLCLKLTDQEEQTHKERQEALNQWFTEQKREEWNASFFNHLTVLEV